MTTPPPQMDLFGTPVVVTPAATPKPTTSAPINDMAQIESVLADVTSKSAARLHRDDTGRVTRCDGGTAAPVPASDTIAAAVAQLIDGRFLTITRPDGDCATADHGPVVITTPAGRGTASRWRAYRPLPGRTA